MNAGSGSRIPRSIQDSNFDYTVAVSIPPQRTSYRDIILAQRRVIELIGPKNGEKCVDVPILSIIVDYMVKNYKYQDLFITVDRNEIPADNATSSTSSITKLDFKIDEGQILVILLLY